MSILVDSAFYIDQQRARNDVRQILGPWLLAGELRSCGIIRAEVLRGIVKRQIAEDLTEFFDFVPEIPTDGRLWQEVARLAWELDRRGIVLPLTDLAISCCALRENSTLISTDAHFRRVPGLKVRAELPK